MMAISRWFRDGGVMEANLRRRDGQGGWSAQTHDLNRRVQGDAGMLAPGNKVLGR